MITEEELRTKVCKHVAARGASFSLAVDAGANPADVTRVKQGYPIPTTIARHFGYRKVILYEKIE